MEEQKSSKLRMEMNWSDHFVSYAYMYIKHIALIGRSYECSSQEFQNDKKTASSVEL